MGWHTPKKLVYQKLAPMHVTKIVWFDWMAVFLVQELRSIR